DPALKDRLVGLRLQKSELEQDIARFQDAQATSEFNLSPDKLGKLFLEGVTVGHLEVRLEGSPTILEKLARSGASKSCAEVLSFAQGWRPREDSNLRPPV